MTLIVKKEKHKEQKEKETYPCLREGTNTGVVILFTSYNEGTVIYQGTKKFPIGYHDTNWIRGKSKPFIGKITLEMKD